MESENIIVGFIGCEKKVAELLESDVRCRNDDMWLILQYWQKQEQIKLFVPYGELHNMTSCETITRCRRKIQNTKKLFLPSDPEVMKKRRFKRGVLTSYFA